MQKSQYKYKLYDLTLHSDLGLSELQTISDKSEPDVSIRHQTLEEVPETDSQPKAKRIHAKSDSCRITYDSVGTFLIKEGNQIFYDPASPSETNKKSFRRILENQVMTVLLLQRGLLVLHASAVSIDDKAVVFLGDRTAGKSTMTAALHQHGYPMLADDVVAIRFDENTPMVVPGVPQIRLNSEAVENLGIEDAVRFEHDLSPEKLYQTIENQSPPVPIGQVYSLNEQENVTLNVLDGSTAFFELVVNTYAQGLLPDTGTTTNHFEQCNRILTTTSVSQLNRPKEYERLPAVIDAIREDVNELSGHNDKFATESC